MKDVVVESIIRENLDKIVDILVSHCGDKYYNHINDKIGDLLVYVYSDEFQYKRMKEIDYLEIAKEFAKDFTVNLNVTRQRKEQLKPIIAKLILETSNLVDKTLLVNSNALDYIKKELTKFEKSPRELTSNINMVIMLEIIKNYQNDHAVKSTTEKLNDYDDFTKNIKERLIDIKRNILNDYFAVYLFSDDEVVQTWELLSNFRGPMAKLINVSEYREEILANQAEFYKHLGANGNTVGDILDQAIEMKIEINSDIANRIEAEYLIECSKYYNGYISNHTTFDRICNELKKNNKEMVGEEIYRELLLTKPSLAGVNVKLNQGNAIIFVNNYDMYTEYFVNTCFHEIIHYIGGVNSNINKSRLVYNNDDRYVCLDEAFTNYLACKTSDEYISKYGYFFDVVDKGRDSIYMSTFDYMKEVFNLYGKELIRIHISDNIDLKRANLICNIEQIANSVYNIFNAEEENVDRVTKEEIAKLKRNIR